MIVFPVPLAAFWDRLLIQSLTFDAPPVTAWSRAANGQAWSADIGDALWTGTVTLARMVGRERTDIEPLFDVLRPGGRTFYARDRRRPLGPHADPKGHILGTASPVIQTLPSAREISLSGLPPRYVLTRGDYLSFDRPDGARCLHLVVDALVVSDVAGVSPAFEVTPPIAPGAVTGAAVTLVGASCKAMLVPQSLAKSTSFKTISEGGTFQFVQTLA